MSRTSPDRFGLSYSSVPIYDYHCAKCDETFEKLLMPSGAPPVVCPACGSERVEQMMSAPALHNTSAKNDVLHREYTKYRKRWSENAK
jgi:putative FmdB family regulatory protein